MKHPTAVITYFQPLTKIFGPRREVTGGWRKLYSEGLHNLYSSPNIICVTKSRRMRWAGHVAQ